MQIPRTPKTFTPVNSFSFRDAGARRSTTAADSGNIAKGINRRSSATIGQNPWYTRSTTSESAGRRKVNVQATTARTTTHATTMVSPRLDISFIDPDQRRGNELGIEVHSIAIQMLVAEVVQKFRRRNTCEHGRRRDAGE